MKKVSIIHNPGAGDVEHSKKELLSLIKAAGYKCRYSSTKKNGLKKFDKKGDFLVVAGGDGTVHMVAKELIKKKKSISIALLPLGTANNIAKTLGITGKPEDIIRSWKHALKKKFDAGRIRNVPGHKFFLEGFGFGIFPYLMKEMENKNNNNTADAEEKMKTALKLLYQIVLSYEPHQCHLELDGKNHSGKYLLAEIMNVASIGPNLFLSNFSDPGDELFEIVLLPEKDKEKFSSYILNKIEGYEEKPYLFQTLKAKKIEIAWEGTHLHVDDEFIKTDDPGKIKAEIKQGLLEFLVPGQANLTTY